MKKIIIKLIVLIIIIFSIALVFKYLMNPKNEKSIDFTPETIKNTRAIVYFSPTADNDFDNQAISYAIFIDHKNNTKGLKMKGLELGSVLYKNNTILLEDKNSIKLLDDEVKIFNMDDKQYTGELTGYLKPNDIFFSIYNTGLINGQYHSNIRYGNANGFKLDDIPSYIFTSGSDQSQIYLMTSDIEKGTYEVQTATINDKIQINILTSLRELYGKDLFPLSGILSNDTNLYILYGEPINDNEFTISLLSVNKVTGKQQINLLKSEENSNISAYFPYSVKSSSSIIDNTLYYVDGTGAVYSIDLNTKNMELNFTLKGASNKGNRVISQVKFYKDSLFYLYRSQKEKIFLDRYDLHSKERNQHNEIKGIHPILSENNGKNLSSYDLEIINP
ncbi:hypothetical protein ACQKMD_00670 [Viridibacillus sp. NPDC096237]|uniref:hypothetical protein n=1 Tax=Viridibacillus sp. NPDC096237 TaxID=3390721 RepID=UPI003CFC14A8